METEFSDGQGLTLRVDGEVLEVLLPGASHRVLLAKLQVLVQTGGK